VKNWKQVHLIPLSRNVTHPLMKHFPENNQLREALQNQASRLSETSKQIGTVCDDNRRLEREFGTLKTKHGELYRAALRLRDIARENRSSPFPLEHPNNVARARAARPEQPLQTRIENLQVPDGGLLLGGRRPPPALTAQFAIKAEKRRFGAAGDGRPPGSGGQNGDHEKAKSDPDGRPGPAVAEGGEGNKK
jgi:hypothetical protein